MKRQPDSAYLAEIDRSFDTTVGDGLENL